MSFQNPAALFQLMNLWNRFQNSHPKFPKFLKAVTQNGIKEGSIVEIEIEEKIEGRHICMVEDRQKPLSVAARHLIRLLKGKEPA